MSSFTPLPPECHDMYRVQRGTQGFLDIDLYQVVALDIEPKPERQVCMVTILFSGHTYRVSLLNPEAIALHRAWVTFQLHRNAREPFTVPTDSPPGLASGTG